MKPQISGLLLCILCAAIHQSFCQPQEPFHLNERDYFEKQGLNVLVFSNWYNGLFSDSKMSGIEIIHHGVRTATNGDVRLDRTPEQWDAIPEFTEREIDTTNQTIAAYLRYPDYDFEYIVKVKPDGEGIRITVILEKELPVILEGKAGFNIEFLPAAYFEKSYLMDDQNGTFPLYPSGPMEMEDGKPLPMPLHQGRQLVLSPEDPESMITIVSTTNLLSLYDGRNQAQNGWFVVRSLIPSNQTGTVIDWHLSGSVLPNWIRTPVIGHSQAGYHPRQKKIAIIELDKNDTTHETASLFKINNAGSSTAVLTGKALSPADFTRYQYSTFDFSDIQDEGLYFLKYGDTQTKLFQINRDVFVNAWHLTNDIFMPVQMDHVVVNEAYRVWHGKSHMDDALQAPVNHMHFDLYAQGSTTDSPFKPGEHIPGLNIGGWYDAGDYDIRTQTHYYVVQNLVHAWEDFLPERDQTLVDQVTGYVDLHHPDGRPDILQQIEHGVLALIAQHRAVGHAIPGIIVPDLSQYTHLGDGLTMTDNLIYDSRLDSLESDGFSSGTFDDRWAFTSRSSALNYGSAAALAAASRVLENKNLARECLETAIKVWDEEHNKTPDVFRVGNTTGGELDDEELKVAVELLLTTNEEKYADRITDLWPTIDTKFARNAVWALKVLPFMNKAFQEKMKARAKTYLEEVANLYSDNPYGVPITRGGWAGNGTVIWFGLTNYHLHKAYPGLFTSDLVLKALTYLYGCHPGSDISFVSGVGTKSKKVAYGMNRADFSFIAGGIVPGVLILPPDFPENKEDWPFLWGENEYVISLAASYIYLVNAANELLR